MKKARFALVNLIKPHDIAIVCQLALAFELEIFLVGSTITPTHKKVISKLVSWNIDQASINSLRWKQVDTLDELKNSGYRLLATTPHKGDNLFTFSIQEMDIFVLGGAAGLSKENLNKCSLSLTIPCQSTVPFLTVGSVVPLIIGHINT